MVKDKIADETLPFIVVEVPGTSKKAQTDFDGNYTIELSTSDDSLRATCFGMKPLTLPLTDENVQTINFLMVSNDIVMDAVEIVAPENPSYAIMRNVMKHKSQNDSRALESYQYELYLRNELDVDNISEEFKNQKVTKNIGETLEQSTTVIDEYGNEVLPVFISENISDFYYRRDPQLQREYVKASKVSGIGVRDESFMSQLLGGTFMRVNFYENAVDLFDKQFLSPISDGWKANYHYILEDTVEIDGYTCYQLEIKPKREQDLAFWGHIYITDEDYALKKMNVRIPNEANLNFIEEVRIDRTWRKTEAGPWLEYKTNVFVDLTDIGKNLPSMIMKVYSTNDSVIVNQPKDRKFYNVQMELAEDANEKNEEYWKENRHDTLSKQKLESAKIIEDLNNTPTIKTYVDVLDLLFYGYKTFGKVDFGRILSLYAYNKVEEHRLRLGMRTNRHFSKKIELKGYAAYGTGDEIWKYGIGVRLMLDRVRWTEVGFSRKYDLEQLGVTDQNIGSGNALFKATTRWGNVIGGYYNTINQVYAFRQVNSFYSQKVTMRTWDFNPASTFNFGYYKDHPNNTVIANNLATTEVIFNSHFSKNERFVQKGNDRVSFGSAKYPELDVQYTYGNTFLDGDFEYHKLDIAISQSIGLNAWGQTRYNVSAGKVFNTLPYPLLKVHLGNQYFFYSEDSYNLMNFFEFVSDQYVSVRHEHHFNGFIMNRIPLIAKLKWRVVTNFNILWGSVTADNYNLVPAGYTEFQPFTSDPYAEVGYGIENIFKIIRIQMFHRLTYLDRENVSEWRILFGAQFSL